MADHEAKRLPHDAEDITLENMGYQHGKSTQISLEIITVSMALLERNIS